MLVNLGIWLLRRLKVNKNHQHKNQVELFNLKFIPPTPPILLQETKISEVNFGDMTVEVEPSHQYSITFHCCVTDGTGGALWQNGTWHGSVDEVKVCHWNPSCRKSCTHWHSVTLAEQSWRPNSEVVGGAFQQWEQQQWVASTGELGQIFTSAACRLLFIGGANT